jgi:hypothetical protein
LRDWGRPEKDRRSATNWRRISLIARYFRVVTDLASMAWMMLR